MEPSGKQLEQISCFDRVTPSFPLLFTLNKLQANPPGHVFWQASSFKWWRDREWESEREIAAGTHLIRSTQVIPPVSSQGKTKEIASGQVVLHKKEKSFVSACVQ